MHNEVRLCEMLTFWSNSTCSSHMNSFLIKINKIIMTWMMMMSNVLIFKSTMFNQISWDEFLIIGKCICHHHVYVLLPLYVDCFSCFSFLYIFLSTKMYFQLKIQTLNIVYKYILWQHTNLTKSVSKCTFKTKHWLWIHHRWHLYIY